MPVITPDTFNALNRYVSVRLQQGVPLVDADWNAVDDTRRFELRAFLKWYVGDGVPYGNDGFRIQTTGANDDFKIASGITGTVDPLANVGRCLVNGVDVMIAADINFKAQLLHTSQAGAAALAATRGVPVIAAPPATGDVSIYLDVWERPVTVSEDPALQVAGVGVESCARLKREWVVRVHTGFGVPQPGDADAIAGHSYYELARFTRAAAGPISAAILVDRRDQRLFLPPATLSTDLFGTDPRDYRRGLGRPALPLRDAINSLLRGEIPSTDSTQIAPSVSFDVPARAYVFDGSGGIVAFWRSNRNGGINQIWEARIDMGVLPYAATGAAAVSPAATSHQHPAAARLPNGDLLIAYASASGASSDVLFKRGSFATLPGLGDTPVANTAALQEDRPMIVVSGTAVLFFYQSQPAGNRVWNVRRYDLGTSSFSGAATAVFSAATTLSGEGHAAVDPAGNAWLAAEANAPAPFIAVAQVSSLGVTTYQSGTELQSTTTADLAPFTLPLANGDVRVFWHAGVTGSPTPKDGLWCGTRTGGTWQLEQIPDTDVNDTAPAAVEDARGGIWLFWVRKIGLRGGIQFRYRDPRISAWGEVKQLIGPTTDNGTPTPFIDASGGIWVFWGGQASAVDYDVWFKRLVPAI